MKRILLASVLFFPTICSANLNGNDLLELCGSDDNTTDTFICASYINGYLDGWLFRSSLHKAAIEYAQKEMEKKNNPDYAPFFFSMMAFEDVGNICLPGKATGNQVKLVTLKYLKENPTLLHLGANELVHKALNRGFPCK